MKGKYGTSYNMIFVIYLKNYEQLELKFHFGKVRYLNRPDNFKDKTITLWRFYYL